MDVFSIHFSMLAIEKGDGQQGISFMDFPLRLSPWIEGRVFFTARLPKFQRCFLCVNNYHLMFR
jgi:hypothetical protein